MAAHAVTKHHYKYVSDNGTTYQLRIADYLATQTDTGGDSILGAVLADGTEPKLGGGHQIRRALMRDLANNVDRLVPVMTPDAPLISVPTPAGANTLSINRGTNSFTYTYRGRFLTETRGVRA
jgi:hypothetical protein